MPIFSPTVDKDGELEHTLIVPNFVFPNELDFSVGNFRFCELRYFEDMSNTLKSKSTFLSSSSAAAVDWMMSSIGLLNGSVSHVAKH